MDKDYLKKLANSNKYKLVLGGYLQDKYLDYLKVLISKYPDKPYMALIEFLKFYGFEVVDYGIKDSHSFAITKEDIYLSSSGFITKIPIKAVPLICSNSIKGV